MLCMTTYSELEILAPSEDEDETDPDASGTGMQDDWDDEYEHGDMRRRRAHRLVLDPSTGGLAVPDLKAHLNSVQEPLAPGSIMLPDDAR